MRYYLLSFFVVASPEIFAQSELQTLISTLEFAARNLWVGLAIVLCINAYYRIMIWREKQKHLIIPLFKPPKGFTPSALRFILTKRFDDRVMSAALIDMAAKGHLTLEQDEKNRLILHREESDEKLSKSQQALLDELFPGENKIFNVVTETYQKFVDAQMHFASALENEFKGRLYNKKSDECVIVLMLTLPFLVLFSFFSGSLIYSLVTLVGIVIMLFEMDPNYYKKGQELISLTTKAEKALHSVSWKILAVFLSVVVGVLLVPYALYVFSDLERFYLLALIVTMVINLNTFGLLHSFTKEGIVFYQQAEGLKMFLKTAMKDQLNSQYSEKSKYDYFHKYVPYAIALGVEHEWSDALKRGYYSVSHEELSSLNTEDLLRQKIKINFGPFQFRDSTRQ